MAEITEQPEEQPQQTTTATAEAGTATQSNLSAGGDIGEKFNTAKQKKAAGDEAFKNNDLAGGKRRNLRSGTAPHIHHMRVTALRNYHEVRCGRDAAAE